MKFQKYLRISEMQPTFKLQSGLKVLEQVERSIVQIE